MNYLKSLQKAVGNVLNNQPTNVYIQHKITHHGTTENAKHLGTF